MESFTELQEAFERKGADELFIIKDGFIKEVIRMLKDLGIPLLSISPINTEEENIRFSDITEM